ncbi:unnamed protein product [Ambrosiozyma monospora]|uniref:Unnamed protein product n=1 Tax=Ambrosiozyma monospora TaxID=43982 RepID=A0ACB5U6K4_AMBMO|nr:unnamed protein product [Ambrosiozyma monospora]
MLSAQVKSSQPSHVQRKLKESCYQGSIVARSAYLFLLKMLNPSLSEYDDEVQRVVKLIVEDVSKVSVHSQICVICTWPFSVFGAAVVDPEQREFLIWRIEEFSRVWPMHCFETVANFLKDIWGTQECPGVGWNALLDRQCLKHLFV